MTYPAMIFWALAFACLWSRGPFMYGLFFVSWSFGMLAMLPPEAVGASFFPVWIILVIFTVRTILDVGPKAYLGALFDFRRFGVLTACTLYAVFSAIMLPRIFAGRIDVITMRLETIGATGLAPNMGNLIHAIYFVLTTLLVVNIYFAAGEPARRKALLNGFGWGAVAVVVTGLADMIASAAGLSSLLQPYRNAAYVLMNDNVVSDMRRVIGLMSEASAYAAICISFLALLAMTPEDQVSAPWGRWRMPLVLALVVMTYLSTSSGGYLALACTGLVALIGVGLGMLDGRRPAWRAAYWILLLAVAVLGVAVFEPQLFEAPLRMVDILIFDKPQSDSYLERSMWNHMALQAFLQSGGLGAGVGCCRTSSWIYAVLSNIGVPGAALTLIFIAQVFLARAADPKDRSLLRITKLALLPILFSISLASPSADVSLGAACLFGMAFGLARPATVARREAAAACEPEAAAARPTALPGFGWAQLAMLERRRRG